MSSCSVATSSCVRPTANGGNQHAAAARERALHDLGQAPLRLVGGGMFAVAVGALDHQHVDTG